MVRNTTGGTRTKGLARKHQVRGDSKLRLPDDELEQVACVTKMLGNGMCEIFTNKNERLIGHIRNKFRGRQKRHNMISTSAIVLVGLREWENPIKNCDILTIYDDSQVNQLKNKGYKARKIGQNKYGLYQVAYSSFQTRAEADIALEQIRVLDNQAAWILNKEIN